jgi:SAM-dependent methyltransferase
MRRRSRGVNGYACYVLGMPAYIADQQSWSQEALRLGSLEDALDRSTARYLQQLGLTMGMHCLEIGAGSGSVARWMAERVGASGAVVATDLDTTLLVPLTREHSQLWVRQEDVEHQSPRLADGGLFDLAHARLVLGHLRDRERALRNIVHAVRPGGWVLIEDVDFLWTELGEQPLHPEQATAPYFRVWSEVVRSMNERGYGVHFGRRLAGQLRSIGLELVAGEAVMAIGNPSLQRAMRLTIERFATELVDEGRLDDGELRACLRVMDDPELIFTGSPMFSVWGRRPLSVEHP